MVQITSQSNGMKEILPIFFDVTLDDIKLKTSLYGDELSKHAKKYEAVEVKAWAEALLEVGKIKGWTLRDSG